VSEYDREALAHYGVLRHEKKKINVPILEVHALQKCVMIPTLNIVTSCTSHKPHAKHTAVKLKETLLSLWVQWDRTVRQNREWTARKVI
jgi:hypothetical protein